jgi:integrase
MRFTDKCVAALKPKGHRYEVWEDGRTGFGVRIAPSGRKSWLFMYRFGGKARRMTLGQYPRIGLASARVAFAEAKRRQDHGQDPGALALAEKRSEREASTGRELVSEYLERSAKDLKSYAAIKRILEADVVSVWGSRKANSIKRRDVILLLDSIVDRGAPVMANRTLGWIRRMFNFAISRDIMEANPCFGIEIPSRESKRERVLTDGEIVNLWHGLTRARANDDIRIAAKLILVTAQRPGEVSGAAKSELDLDGQRVWLIPAERSKNGRPHVVPLSPLAVELFRKALAQCAGRGENLFCNISGSNVLSSEALGHTFLRNSKVLGIQRPPWPDDGSFADPSEAMALRRERRRQSFAPHDLRRTAATRMTELGFTRFVVDRLLNHTESGVGSVYDRYEYLREKREALEAWAARLEEIVTGRKADEGKVVPLRPA